MAKKNTLKYYQAVGRRKSATARVRLYIVGNKEGIVLNEQAIKKGEIFINSRKIDSYFGNILSSSRYKKPFELTQSIDRFAVSIKVAGGGFSGQLDAIIHGIARALDLVDKSYRPVLKKEGLLTRDPRVRERRKVGTGGKARRKKQSPKR